MADHWRETTAVIITVDSPAGQVTQDIDDVAAHLPPPGQDWGCRLCSTQPWPCPTFDSAAGRIIAAGVRLADLVPLDLHPRLWPPRTPQT